jgi:hypothetical protein
VAGSCPETPFEDAAQRQQRIDAQLPISTFRAAMIVGGGSGRTCCVWRSVAFSGFKVISRGIDLLLTRLG